MRIQPIDAHKEGLLLKIRALAPVKLGEFFYFQKRARETLPPIPASCLSDLRFFTGF